jgi:succinate dehydrogenase/fumarate reductase flavoprotein subunit
MPFASWQAAWAPLLVCDATKHAQVLNAQGESIQGLYAGGNDLSSVMGGNYPSGGITLGPAMTFGYLAAHHAVPSFTRSLF